MAKSNRIPYDGVLKLKTDIVDQRKIRQVRAASKSFMFNPPELADGRIIQGNQEAWEKLADMIGKEGAQQVADGLLAYFYQGGTPKFDAPVSKADNVLQNIVKAIEAATIEDANGNVVPMLQAQREMSQANVWTSDTLGGLTFNSVVRRLIDEDMEPKPDDGGGKGDGSGGDGQGDGSGGGGGQGQQQGDSGGQGGKGTGDGGGDQPGGNGASLDGNGGGVDKGVTADGTGKEKAKVTKGDKNSLDARVKQALNEVAKDLGTADVKGASLQDKIEFTHGSQNDMDESPFAPKAVWTNAKRVADRMGRIKNVLVGAMNNKTFYSNQNPVKVTYGDNIRNAVKSQLVHIGEETEHVLLKQIMDKQLMQRQMVAVNKSGKGPIIMCIDVSGSMHGDILPEWAFGLAGAIGWASAHRHREVAYVYYSDSVPDILHVPAKMRRDTERLDRAIGSVVHNPHIGSGKPHPLSVIPQLQAKGIGHVHAYKQKKDGSGAKPWKCVPNGGGTDYAIAFDAVYALMRLNPKWKSADVLFLSDGQDAGRMSMDGQTTEAQRICAHLQRHGVRVYGIGLTPKRAKAHEHDDDYLPDFTHSMGYFNAHVIAEVSDDTNAEDVLIAIGQGL